MRERNFYSEASKHDITYNIKVLGDNYGTKTTLYRITTWDLFVVSIMDLLLPFLGSFGVL